MSIIFYYSYIFQLSSSSKLQKFSSNDFHFENMFEEK